MGCVWKVEEMIGISLAYTLSSHESKRSMFDLLLIEQLINRYSRNFLKTSNNLMRCQ